jgi:hypothetical protein
MHIYVKLLNSVPEQFEGRGIAYGFHSEGAQLESRTGSKYIPT